MKSIHDVEAGWRSFADGLVQFAQIPGRDVSALRQALSQEVNWITSRPTSIADIPTRMRKYQTLQKNEQIKMDEFDYWWRERLAFFEWVLD